MPIVFESLKDPYGIGAAGTILGNALMQRNMEALQNKRQLESEERQKLAQIETEQRKLAQQKLTNEAMAKAYRNNDLSTPAGLQSFLSEVTEGGGDASPILRDILKQQMKDQSNNQLFEILGIQGNSPVQKNDQWKGFPFADPSQQPNNGSQTNKFTNDQLVGLSASNNKNVASWAKTMLQKRQLDDKKFNAERKYESERSTPVLNQADKQRMGLRSKKFAVPLMKSAIQEGNLSFFSPDNLATVFGIEGLRTAKGAQLVTATKEFLLGNISRAGSRPNQWIEQQISTMLPQIGRSEEANLTVAEMLGAEVDLEEKYLQTLDSESAKDKEEYGYVKGDIASRVDNLMKDYENKQQDKLSWKLRQIHESQLSDEQLGWQKKVPKGTPLTERMGQIILKKAKDDPALAVKIAEKMGFKILTPEEINGYSQ